MIDEKDLIKDLKECKAMREFDWTTETLISLLESAPKVSQWISVSERLPIKVGYYLVSCKGGNVHIDFSLRGKWDNKYEHEIIAWQSLPEPYREET